MGDAVNLAARLMAQAEPAAPAEIYATADVLDRSNTLFATTELEPFAVKGKAQPVQAWSVGPAEGSRTRQVTLQRLPLTGRNAELGVIRKALTSARSGAGRLIEIIGDAGIGKTRLLEALRDAAAGFNKLHATCEAYTSSIPYVVWRELLREMFGFGRTTPDAPIVERIRAEVVTKVPDLAPWLPLLAAVFDVEIAATPEVELLAESNRRAKLHETVTRFLETVVPDKLLVEIDDVHHMDEASAVLLAHLMGGLAARSWLFAVGRRASGTGFEAPEMPETIRVELKPLAPQDALRLAQLATAQSPLPPHVLDVVATRSGGNPQFLRDLVRTAIESGGIADLPESAEAATMTQIDTLPPEDRALVRRVAVFGLTFHPRMLSWLYTEEDGPAPHATALDKLGDLFDEEPDGYLRFRQTLLRDSAYAGLPFKLRRRLHASVAAQLEEELEFPEEAGDLVPALLRSRRVSIGLAVRQGCRKARGRCLCLRGSRGTLRARARGGLQASRSAEARDRARPGSTRRRMVQGGGVPQVARRVHRRTDPVAGERLLEAELLLKLSRVEEKLGRFPEALRWVERAREALERAGTRSCSAGCTASVWYATVLQAQGRTADALKWAEQGAREAEAVADPELTGDAYMVMGWGYSVLGKEVANC